MIVQVIDDGGDASFQQAGPIGQVLEETREDRLRRNGVLEPAHLAELGGVLQAPYQPHVEPFAEKELQAEGTEHCPWWIARSGAVSQSEDFVDNRLCFRRLFYGVQRRLKQPVAAL